MTIKLIKEGGIRGTNTWTVGEFWCATIVAVIDD